MIVHALGVGRWGWAILAACTLVVSGCNSSSDGAYPGAQAACHSDGDCPTGQACNTPLSRCAPLASSPLALEVLPPNSQPEWVRKEFINPRILDDQGVELRLDAAAVFEGRVQASDRPEEAIPARVLASRESLLQGRPPVQFETTTELGDGGTNGGLRFSLQINPGHHYGVQVLPRPPADTTLPCREQGCLPGYPSAAIDDIYLEGSRARDVVLDGQDRSVEIRGRILDAAGLPFAFGVRVRATSLTGARSSLGITCSAATSEQHCTCDDKSCFGDFRIRVPRGNQVYTLRVDPISTGTTPDDDTATLVPSLECLGLTVPTPDDSEQPSKPLELADPIRFPAFPLAEQYQATILDSKTNPVAGAQVTFVTRGLALVRTPVDFTSCEAAFQRSAITDAEGHASLRLLPGGRENRPYDVAVASPAQSIYTSRQIEGFEIGPQGGALGAIELHRRMTVSGTLYTHAGKPLAGATMEAQGITPKETPSGQAPVGASSTVTETDGAFVLPVDPGAYNLNISPPPSTGIPGFSVTALSFDEAVEGLALEAPKPMLAIGRVTDSAGEPAAKVTVQAYDLVPLSVGGTEVLAITRGSTISDEEGRFRLVVPWR